MTSSEQACLSPLQPKLSLERRVDATEEVGGNLE